MIIKVRFCSFVDAERIFPLGETRLPAYIVQWRSSWKAARLLWNDPPPLRLNPGVAWFLFSV